KENLQQTRKMLAELARERGHPPALFQAMLQPGLALYHVSHRSDPGNMWVMTAEELEDEASQARARGQESPWVKGAEVPVAPGEFRKLDAETAVLWGVARYGDVEDVKDLYSRYQLDPAKVRVSSGDWLDEVAEFFRGPLVKLLLIVVGIAGLILELKMPGL